MYGYQSDFVRSLSEIEVVVVLTFPSENVKMFRISSPSPSPKRVFFFVSEYTKTNTLKQTKLFRRSQNFFVFKHVRSSFARYNKTHASFTDSSLRENSQGVEKVTHAWPIISWDQPLKYNCSLEILFFREGFRMSKIDSPLHFTRGSVYSPVSKLLLLFVQYTQMYQN